LHQLQHQLQLQHEGNQEREETFSPSEVQWEGATGGGERRERRLQSQTPQSQHEIQSQIQSQLEFDIQSQQQLQLQVEVEQGREGVRVPIEQLVRAFEIKIQIFEHIF
jgi:hypothetical protein